MFNLKRNGRKIKNTPTFDSYDAARGYARRMIRKAVKPNEVTEDGFSLRRTLGWDNIARNPVSIRQFGYEIVSAA
jgi:hypothetical protein